MKTKAEVETFCAELTALCNKWGVVISPNTDYFKCCLEIFSEDFQTSFAEIDYMERSKKFEPVDY